MLLFLWGVPGWQGIESMWPRLKDSSPAFRHSSPVYGASALSWAGVWCRAKHEKNVIDVSAVSFRESGTPALCTSPHMQKERERKTQAGNE